MSSPVHPKDRVAVFAAYLSPVYGLPLLGPWVLSSVMAEDSTARPHVMRAFDLHLAAMAFLVVFGLGGLFFMDSPAYVVVGMGFALVFVVADLLLLFWAVRGTSRSLWEPIVLGRRRFYHQEPFTG
jgi:hypothetical protein